MENEHSQMSLLSGLVPEKEDGPASPAAADSAKPAKKARKPKADDTTQAQKKSGSKDTPSRSKPQAKSTKAKSAAASDNAPRDDLETLPLDRFLCFALYSANHAMHKVYKPLLDEVGLTYPQYLAMTVLWEKDKVPVGTLTERLQLETSTLTPLLKRLETMGLVERKRSTKDERQVRVSLTRKGRALKAKTAHFAGCILASTGLSRSNALDLQNQISSLRDALRASDEES